MGPTKGAGSGGARTASNAVTGCLANKWRRLCDCVAPRSTVAKKFNLCHYDLANSSLWRFNKLTNQTREVLQRILQCDTGWRTSLPSAVKKFGCPHCHAKYSIIRRQTPPGMIPACEDCDQEFLPREYGEWLVYERADA